MRTRLIAAALVAAAALPASAVQAQSETAASTVPAARLAKATRLVELLNPHDQMVAANVRGWEVGIAAALKGDPSFASLEAQHPGVTEAAIAGARPLGMAYVEKFVSTALARKAALTAEGLSDAELDEAIAFFEGPVGRKFVARLTAEMGGNIDEVAAKKVKEARETGAIQFSERELQGHVQRAAMQSLEDISSEESLALMRFASTEASRKLNAAATASDRELLGVINNPPADFVADQGQALQKAAVAFIDRKK